MAELAKGRLFDSIRKRRRDEFGELSNAFHAMTDALLQKTMTA